MIISKVNKRKSCTPFLFKEFQESVLNRVKDDHCVKATTSYENKRRRTVCLARKNGLFGFTLQTYGIKREVVDPSQNPDNELSIQLITYIDYVALDSPACHAGLKRGDVILAVNGLSMESSGHEELVSYIASQQAIRMVVLFEDCSQKIDLNLRYLKLKEILEAKMKELLRVELQEKIILSSCTERDVLSSFDCRPPSFNASLKPCHHSSLAPLFKLTPPPQRSNVKRLSAAILMITNRASSSSSKKKTMTLANLPTSTSHSGFSSLTLPLPTTTVPFIDTPSLSTPSPGVPRCSSPNLSSALVNYSSSPVSLSSPSSEHRTKNPGSQKLRRSSTLDNGNAKYKRGLTRSLSACSRGLHLAPVPANTIETTLTESPNRCSTPITTNLPRVCSADFEILNLSRSPNEKSKATTILNKKNNREIEGDGRDEGKELHFTRL